MNASFVKSDALTAYLRDICADVPEASPVLIHSDIARIGILDAWRGERDMGRRYEAVIDAAMEGRPYLIPAFNYDFLRDGVYDVVKSPARIGALGRHFAGAHPECRTHTPVFNFVIRNDSGRFPRDPCLNPFGPGSTLDQLWHHDGYILMWALPYAKGFTGLHYAEERKRVGYRYIKRFTGVVRFETTETVVHLDYRVRPPVPGAGKVGGQWLEPMLERGMGFYPFEGRRFGSLLIPFRRFIDYTDEMLAKDELHFLDEEGKRVARRLYEEHGRPLQFETVEGIATRETLE